MTITSRDDPLRTQGYSDAVIVTESVLRSSKEMIEAEGEIFNQSVLSRVQALRQNLEKIFLPVFDSKDEENGDDSAKEQEEEIGIQLVEDTSPIDHALINKQSIEDSIMERLRMTANE